ncbi:MAG: P-loop NTPase fold protein [Sedimentisphaerales bacterium]
MKYSEDEIIRDELVKAFNYFLLHKKGFPENVISQDQIIDVDKPSADIALIDPESSRVLALVEFSTRSQSLDSLKELAQEYFSEISSSNNIKYYIVEMAGINSSEQFKIFLLSNEDGVKPISRADFPNFEELKRTVINKKLALSDLENIFRENLIAFLISEKKFPRESLSHGILAEAPDLDLTVTHPDTNSVLAIFDFKSENYRINSSKPSEFMAKVHKKGFVGEYNPFVYMVTPSKESNEEFVIFEVEDDGTSNRISYEDFPFYNQLLFASPLSGAGRRLYRSLIELAKDKHSLSIEARCKDYINLQIKKNKRTAAQIHRINNSDKNIALVLAGYQEVFPDSKSETYMVRGEINQISGNTREYPKEIAWLNGNVNHEQLKYRAGVYIIRPGSLVLEDVENEVGELLDLARKKAGGESVETESKMSAVVGGIATIRVEGVGGEDRLGREKLVKTLAGMFEKTECDYGFTMALLGDWGQGKSTVMELLKKELREKHEGEFKFAKYNAWEYENTDNIAAGIAQEVVGGLMKNAGSWKTIGLQIRFAGTEHRQELAYVLFYFLLTINILLWGVPLINRFVFFEGFVRELLGISGAIGVGVLAVYSLKVLKQAFEHPIAVKMRTYLKLPDYGEHLGFLPVLKSHIERLCSLLLGKEQKLVVFVDDLDRCNVDHISKVLDAIRLVMTIPNVIVMIGIDHNIAFKAVGKHYKLLAEREDGNKRTSADVARDYLGKIIQLPLRLMPASNVGLKEYVEKKLFDEKNLVDDSEAVKTPEDTISDNINTNGLSSGRSTADESLTDTSGTTASGGEENEEEVSDETISEAIKDTKSERDEFYKLAEKYEFRNPRQLLRLHNSFRFLKGFGSGQGEKGYHTLDMLTMLFWQEFLHNWPMKTRGRCMAVLIDKVHAEKVEPIVRRVLNNVKDDIRTLFNEEPTRYEELAKFVRVVVLPHNEEGVLDSTEAIKDWLDLEKKAEEEEALRRKESNL